ncbi:MAG: Clp protease [Acinetobacter sp.]
MQRVLRLTLAGMILLYPFLVGWALSHGYLWQVAVLFLLIGLIRLIFQRKAILGSLTILAIICGAMGLIFQHSLALKLYPVAMNFGALLIFATSLWRPPSMIERFARVFEPELPESGVRWTRRVTQVWCLFFIINGGVALYSALFSSMQFWVFYNGCISYLLMGALFLGEFILRKRHMRKLNKIQQMSMQSDQQFRNFQ